MMELFEHSGPVSDLWFQVFIYAAGSSTSFWALALYGGWLWRMRHQWEQVPLGWMLFGMCLDRLAWGVNELWWGLTKFSVGYELAHPSWLGQSGWFPKVLGIVAMGVIIFSFYKARNAARSEVMQ